MELFRDRPGSGWEGAVRGLKEDGRGGRGVDGFLDWARQDGNKSMVLTAKKTSAGPEAPSAGTRRVGEGGGGSIISGSCSESGKRGSAARVHDATHK